VVRTEGDLITVSARYKIDCGFNRGVSRADHDIRLFL